MFSLMDFIQDANFIRWVREKDPADNKDWEEWLAQHPDKRSLVAEARRVLESIEIPQKPISPKVIQLETQKLLETIGVGLSALETDDRPASSVGGAFYGKTRKWWLAAAILAPLAMGIFYFQKSWDSHPQKFAYSAVVSSRHLIERVNTSEKTDTLQFPDGSEVRLAPNSRISYPAGFDTAAVREVYLSGQAFFQVVKNPRHPFRVITGEVVTKVLGTSFCVRSFEKDTTIQVVVRTGKVSVYSQAIPGEPVNLSSGHSVPTESRGEIILTCNQRLVYKKTAQKFQKLLLESPTLITPG
ncbi:MAG: FecR family protein, partial [Chitinophaga rupis]